MEFMIENELLFPHEKKVLSFFADKIKKQKETVINQINQAFISRDFNEFYHIIKFTFDKIPDDLLEENYRFDSTIQILHDDAAPTVFIMFVKNGLVCEFEIYNADLSKLDFEKMCDGNLFAYQI